MNQRFVCGLLFHQKWNILNDETKGTILTGIEEFDIFVYFPVLNEIRISPCTERI